MSVLDVPQPRSPRKSPIRQPPPVPEQEDLNQSKPPSVSSKTSYTKPEPTSIFGATYARLAAKKLNGRATPRPAERRQSQSQSLPPWTRYQGRVNTTTSSTKPLENKLYDRGMESIKKQRPPEPKQKLRGGTLAAPGHDTNPYANRVPKPAAFSSTFAGVTADDGYTAGELIAHMHDTRVGFLLSSRPFMSRRGAFPFNPTRPTRTIRNERDFSVTLDLFPASSLKWIGVSFITFGPVLTRCLFLSHSVEQKDGDPGSPKSPKSPEKDRHIQQRRGSDWGVDHEALISHLRSEARQQLSETDKPAWKPTAKYTSSLRHKAEDQYFMSRRRDSEHLPIRNAADSRPGYHNGIKPGEEGLTDGELIVKVFNAKREMLPSLTPEDFSPGNIRGSGTTGVTGLSFTLQMSAGLSPTVKLLPQLAHKVSNRRPRPLGVRRTVAPTSTYLSYAPVRYVHRKDKVGLTIEDESRCNHN